MVHYFREGNFEIHTLANCRRGRQTSDIRNRQVVALELQGDSAHVTELQQKSLKIARFGNAWKQGRPHSRQVARGNRVKP
ncbi:hypothetical protein Ae201684_014203 [Aphanomyces euteiches]|uniref:Uncharacterized protein n=1 Tax=Aphanomyces euteiches TaxID=100861 RepID=A0A6G0WKT0_9STRA|nr:hypothetical protein Ae201684_014203 [Aphanomyces euteiches]